GVPARRRGGIPHRRPLVGGPGRAEPDRRVPRPVERGHLLLRQPALRRALADRQQRRVLLHPRALHVLRGPHATSGTGVRLFPVLLQWGGNRLNRSGWSVACGPRPSRSGGCSPARAAIHGRTRRRSTSMRCYPQPPARDGLRPLSIVASIIRRAAGTRKPLAPKR